MVWSSGLGRFEAGAGRLLKTNDGGAPGDPELLPSTSTSVSTARAHVWDRLWDSVGTPGPPSVPPLRAALCRPEAEEAGARFPQGRPTALARPAASPALEVAQLGHTGPQQPGSSSGEAWALRRYLRYRAETPFPDRWLKRGAELAALARHVGTRLLPQHSGG